MTRLLKISLHYFSDIEKERSNSPDKDKLDEIRVMLSLNDDEHRYMHE